ncbi:MAG: methyl-accepting chemotaxis protein [Desulfobacteraceae bacterium]
MKKKLTLKLLIPLALLVALGLMASATVAYLISKKALENAVTDQIVQLSDTMASKINTWMARNQIDLENWSNMDTVTKSLGSSEPEKFRDAANSRMKDYIESYQLFSGMRITNDQGMVVASSHIKNIGNVDVSEREYFQKSMNGDLYISNPLVSKTSGKPILVMSAPVKFAGDIKGIIYAVVDLGTFTEKYIDPVKVGETGYVFMINKDGKVLAYPPDKKQIMKLDMSEFDFGRKFMNIKNGVVDYEFQGIKRIGGIKEVPLTEWTVVATAPFSEIFKAAGNVRNVLIFIGVLTTAILIVGIILLVSFFVTKPLNKVVIGLKEIAEGEGDLTNRLPVTTEDEVGNLAASFNAFIEKLHQMITDVSQGVETLSSSSTEMTSIAENMSKSSAKTSDKANTVAAASEEMTANMNSVAASMEQSSLNINTVANSAEEMNSTINEIAQNAENARKITVNAVSKTNESTQMMDELSNAAKAIGEVVETITDISEQVNLLSLNATIEAARAGEAGKGFAVVANEIKDLAKQTSDASMDIKEKIKGIQDSSKISLSSIEEISKVISDVNDMVSAIATAVEEQSSATGDIAENMSQASSGIEEVNSNVNQSSTVATEISKDISEVNQSSMEIAERSDQVKMSAENLSKLASSLDEMVSRFKI